MKKMREKRRKIRARKRKKIKKMRTIIITSRTVKVSILN